MAAATRILMCPPDFFEVGYAINPWMDGNVGRMRRDLAAEQWQFLRDQLSEVADVVLIEPHKGLPDMVFTANAGTVYGDIAVPSNFQPRERRGEEPHFCQWFEDNGFTVIRLPDEIAFEGAGDSLWNRGEHFLWAGHGFRTDLPAHEHLREAFGREVITIKLIDPRFYHIDTCFCPLQGGYVMYHEAAFDEVSRRIIEQRIAPDKRILVSEEDAGHFACNAVNVGERVFLNDASPALERDLARAGFEVVKTPLSEFLKAGGGAKCLTLRIDEPVSP